jgi:Tc5 transposase DNA-binding domain
LKLVEIAGANNIPTSGSMVHEAAKKFELKLKKKKFCTSNGWLHSFRQKHYSVFKAIVGESEFIDKELCNQYVQNIEESYALKNIFNADETALFYRPLPINRLFKILFIKNNTIKCYSSSRKSR